MRVRCVLRDTDSRDGAPSGASDKQAIELSYDYMAALDSGKADSLPRSKSCRTRRPWTAGASC